MIVLTPQPAHHTSAQATCLRCVWALLHYNLVHHTRIRQEHRV